MTHSKKRENQDSKVDFPVSLDLKNEFKTFDGQIAIIKESTIISEYRQPLKGINEGLSKFYTSQLKFDSNLTQHAISLASFWGLLQKIIFEFKDYDFDDQAVPFKKLFLRKNYAEDISKMSSTANELIKATMNIVNKIKNANLPEAERNSKIPELIKTKEMEVILLYNVW